MLKNLQDKIKIIIGIFTLVGITSMSTSAYDTNMSPEVFKSYGKQQIKTTDLKGNTFLITPNYENYAARNKNVSEKVVAIFDKHSPAYGYKYILYTPIGKYVGHRRIMQRSMNGYGYEPIPDGGNGSDTPCFRTIREAKHYYYPEWY